MTGTLSALLAILAGTSLFVAGAGLLSTALGLRAGEIGISGLMTGAIMSAYFAGFIAGTHACPRIVQRAGHVRAFSAFAATAATTVMLHALTDNPAIWLCLRFVTGTAVVGLYMVIESWLNERSSNKDRGRVFAVYQVISLLALGVGQYLLLVPSPEPLASFVIAAALFSVGLVPVVLTRVEQPAPISSVRLDLGSLWAISPLSVAGTFLVAVGNSSLMTLGPVFAQQLGFDTVAVALFMSLLFAGGVAFQWPIGHWSDTHDRRLVILLVSVTGALLALAAFALVEASLPGFLLVMFVYGGAAFTLYPLCIANANDRCAPDRFVATASGLLLVYGVGAVVGPFIAGALLQAFGAVSLPLFLATTQTLLAILVVFRKVAAPSLPVADQETFVMLGRTSQSAIEMLAAEGEANRESGRR